MTSKRVRLVNCAPWSWNWATELFVTIRCIPACVDSVPFQVSTLLDSRDSPPIPEKSTGKNTVTIHPSASSIMTGHVLTLNRTPS
jgi:hypothetical protein